MYAMLNTTVEAAIDLEDKLATAVSVPIEQAPTKAAMQPYLQVLQNLPAVKYGEQADPILDSHIIHLQQVL